MFTLHIMGMAIVRHCKLGTVYLWQSFCGLKISVSDEKGEKRLSRQKILESLHHHAQQKSTKKPFLSYIAYCSMLRFCRIRTNKCPDLCLSIATDCTQLTSTLMFLHICRNCETALLPLINCLIVLIILVCGIVMFICVCSIARAGC